MYHFIGIKGAGMSSLAVIMKQLGYDIQGSDVDKHYFTETELIKNNIKFMPYNEKNIKNDLTIIKGLSITDDNPELIKAKELNLQEETGKKYNILTRAIKEKRKVKILYYSYGKGENERIIDPAEMFLFQDGWYCAAFCEKKQDIRHFELKRIIKYELLAEKYE